MQMDRAEKIGDRMRDAHCAMKGLLRERYETVVADYKEILGGPFCFQHQSKGSSTCSFYLAAWVSGC